MFIYQDSEFHYKSSALSSLDNRSDHSLKATSSRRKKLSLNKKNRKFLENLGFKIKRVQGRAKHINRKDDE